MSCAATKDSLAFPHHSPKVTLPGWCRAAHIKTKAEQQRSAPWAPGNQLPYLPLEDPRRAERRHYYNLLMKARGTLPSVCLGRS